MAHGQGHGAEGIRYVPLGVEYTFSGGYAKIPNKPPAKLVAIPSAVRKTLRSQFHTLLYRARQRKGLRVFALGQRLRHFVDHVTATAGAANGQRVRRWVQEKKVGWYAVLADPQMPVTSTMLDQAHNAIERKLFAMKGFHHGPACAFEQKGTVLRVRVGRGSYVRIMPASAPQ
jgi:hypothetical protein